MRKEQGSSTALGVSMVRTIHQIVDDVPHILEDPISPILLDESTLDKIRKEPEKHRSKAARGLRSHVVLRSRYAEDELQEAAKRGVRQCINLGAGYDTFPYRLPAWAAKMRIIEIDHPATQEAKRAHFRDKGLKDPDNLKFLPLDLEKDDFSNGIENTSLDLEQPLWISCLGVFAYLRRQTVHNIFRSSAVMPKGSGIVFAFAPERATSGSAAGWIPSVADRAAELGEPWLTRFTVEDLKGELQGFGFTEVSFLEPKEAEVRYYSNRTDLPVPTMARLCKAKS
jgi:methyltransferase (TIGR00027 family)